MEREEDAFYHIGAPRLWEGGGVPDLRRASRLSTSCYHIGAPRLFGGWGPDFKRASRLYNWKPVLGDKLLGAGIGWDFSGSKGVKTLPPKLFFREKQNCYYYRRRKKTRPRLYTTIAIVLEKIRSENFDDFWGVEERPVIQKPFPPKNGIP